MEERATSKGQLSHCRNGHPYSEENTIWHAGGTKSCRVCRLVSMAKQRAKRRPVVSGVDEAVKEMERALMALALELPEVVWLDVRRRWFDLRAALEADVS